MKSEGCNHMECHACKIHICWKCLETFEEGAACYAHMTAMHDGFYDGRVYQEEGDDELL
jgi:hypothetical protein